jgi:hypothetical protein
VKREAEAARGVGGGAGATCGADWGVRAVRGTGRGHWGHVWCDDRL